MQRKVNVIEDLNGNKIMVIHDIVFKGKRLEEWTEVESYLKLFVSEENDIRSTGDLVYIGAELPDEYACSDYTLLLGNIDAKHGWYKYTSRFALPIYDGDGELERYKVFHVMMIMKCAEDEKMYLYNIMNIKKETSTLFQ